jgi:hypothetical protein
MFRRQLIKRAHNHFTLSHFFSLFSLGYFFLALSCSAFQIFKQTHFLCFYFVYSSSSSLTSIFPIVWNAVNRNLPGDERNVKDSIKIERSSVLHEAEAQNQYVDEFRVHGGSLRMALIYGAINSFFLSLFLRRSFATSKCVCPRIELLYHGALELKKEKTKNFLLINY